MIENILNNCKKFVHIYTINNGFIVSVEHPYDPMESIKPMVGAMKEIANQGEEWKGKQEECIEKNDKGLHFFTNSEDLMNFLADFYIKSK